MQKRGQVVVIIVIAIIVVAAIIGWQLFKQLEKPDEASNETTAETTINETTQLTEEINESEETNITVINQTEEETTSYYVPDPTGTIRGIDFRNGGEGYFCKYKDNPEHQVKLYTYIDMNGVRNLSESYIESKEIDDVCSYYQDITNESVGMYYNIKWSWSSVEGIDGYRLYQYYSYGNITREYDYYIDLPASYVELIDTGLNLWKWEK